LVSHDLTPRHRAAAEAIIWLPVEWRAGAESIVCAPSVRANDPIRS
jgi:hypothetical protein